MCRPFIVLHASKFGRQKQMYVHSMQALTAVLSNGTDSVFSQQMANRSVDATASASDLQRFPGHSFSDQVFGYDSASSTHLDKVPVALPVGVAIGGALVLAATATLGFYIYRQRKQNKLQKVRA